MRRRFLAIFLAFLLALSSVVAVSASPEYAAEPSQNYSAELFAPADGPREWEVDRSSNTITIETAYTYTNVMSRTNAAYADARTYGNTNVIVQFVHDDNFITGFTVLATGHGADGTSMACSRWNGSRADDTPTFFQNLLAAGTVFGDVEVNTGGGSTFSKRALVYAANYAATVLNLPQGSGGTPTGLTLLIDDVHTPLVEGTDYVLDGNTFNVFKVQHRIPTNLHLDGTPVVFTPAPFDGIHGTNAPNSAGTIYVAAPVVVGDYTVALVNTWVTPGVTPTENTISVTTARNYSNLRSRYANADVIVEFTFTNGQISAFNVVDGGHAAGSTCWRMFGVSGANLGAIPFLQAQLDAGATFPIDPRLAVDTAGAATWSRNALVYAANYAFAALGTNPVQHTVTFDGNGGTPSETSRLVNNNAALGELPTATLADHDFDGWFTAATGGTEVTAATVITGNETFFAQWTAQAAQGLTRGGVALVEGVDYRVVDGGFLIFMRGHVVPNNLYFNGVRVDFGTPSPLVIPGMPPISPNVHAVPSPVTVGGYEFALTPTWSIVNPVGAISPLTAGVTGTITTITAENFTTWGGSTDPDYVAARLAELDDVIIEFTFEGTDLTGAEWIQNAHGADGITPCDEGAFDAAFDALLAALDNSATVFPISGIDTVADATFSWWAMATAANDAFALIDGDVGGTEGEWIVGTPDLATRTVTVGTNREHARPVNSRPQYTFTDYLDIIMTYTFNADGTLASWALVQDGHGLDLAGAHSSCGRWSLTSNNNDDVIPFLNRLIADGVVFPDTTINTSTRATWSKNGVLYTLNYAAEQFTFEAPQGEWIVGTPDLATRTVTVGTNRENTRPQNSRPTNDDYQAWTDNLDVIMQFTFNADGSLASFLPINIGHGLADGAHTNTTCGRWNPTSTNAGDIFPRLNALIEAGTTAPFPMDTTSRASFSQRAVLYTLNYAATQFTFDGGGTTPPPPPPAGNAGGGSSPMGPSGPFRDGPRPATPTPGPDAGDGDDAHVGCLELHVAIQIGSTQIEDISGTLSPAVLAAMHAAFTTAPVISGDRTMVPIRFISYAFGAEVNWTNATATAPLTVLITLDGEVLSIPVGIITPELAALGMDVPAQIIDDRTLVPLYFIGNLFGAVTTWHPETQRIEIYVACTCDLDEEGEDEEATTNGETPATGNNETPATGGNQAGGNNNQAGNDDQGGSDDQGGNDDTGGDDGGGDDDAWECDGDGGCGGAGCGECFS